MKKGNKENEYSETLKRAFERIKKEHPVVGRYKQVNYDSYLDTVKKSLAKKSYIEAFCIADQYVKEIIRTFLNIPEKNDNSIDISKTLEIIKNIYPSAQKFLSIYQRFNRIRDKLVHEITQRKKQIKINKKENLEKLCLKTMEEANNFFEDIMALRFFPYFNYKKQKASNYFEHEIKSMVNYVVLTINWSSDISKKKFEEKILKKFYKILEKPWKINKDLN